MGASTAPGAEQWALEDAGGGYVRVFSKVSPAHTSSHAMLCQAVRRPVLLVWELELPPDLPTLLRLQALPAWCSRYLGVSKANCAANVSVQMYGKQDNRAITKWRLTKLY